MRLTRFQKHFVLLVLAIFGTSGCYSFPTAEPQPEVYSYPETEADWIRGGAPLEFEGELWYPQDDFENLLDTEVFLVSDYKGIEVFAEKMDVRPYNRLYTKFGRNKYRLFLKKSKDE